MMRAVVFAYHNVGVRCIQVLLARGVDVALVVTHQDNPAEEIWFDSVATLCAEHGIAVITPDDPSTQDVFAQVRALSPDFIFSFYYRHMLPQPLLQLARHGAFNLHGSLLPKYRGRVPINWAVLFGERMTGATLHEMVEKPDAGAIVAQLGVPILPDDTAHAVFGKVVVAAEMMLWNVLPEMLAGRTPRLPNDLTQGSYHGGRKAADGEIDWQQPAQAIYNLHRAVAPPYPGAFTVSGPSTFVIGTARMAAGTFPDLPPGLAVVDNCILGVGGDRRALAIHTLLRNGASVTPAQLQQHLSTAPQ